MKASGRTVALLLAFAQVALSQPPETLASLLVRFRERDLAAKEVLLGEITRLV